MSPERPRVSPEQVLAAIYGKSSLETGMSEKRRDEVIAAAIFVSFRNHEFGTRFLLPSDFRETDEYEDAQGIDMTVADIRGRKKKLQVKGIYIKRSILRRMHHNTKGVAKISSASSRRYIKRDSEELTRMMNAELAKIIQDYSGLYLLIHVIADLATQTSLEIAIRKSQQIVSHLKAKEVWFLRNIPVLDISDSPAEPNSHAYELIQVSPAKHTYCFAFIL
jgi:hypothetical protein